ncbi:flavodoxin family protein [Scytonema millei]|uniref:Flavodoxin family protein n=1 Tax=Scytonema millei VB511283 TaxID=1245923 RepID=A0A9X5I4V0_9CYAN|nr:flavodoxin family protein [Scytonema millei]NHC35983.1 flavodoxin family protein [Scytonema millei VB511283]
MVRFKQFALATRGDRVLLFDKTTHDGLFKVADGVIFGSPTRYGNMTAQMKQWI